VKRGPAASRADVGALVAAPGLDPAAARVEAGAGGEPQLAGRGGGRHRGGENEAGDKKLRRGHEDCIRYQLEIAGCTIFAFCANGRCT
jgi:hypothetical protein